MNDSNPTINQKIQVAVIAGSTSDEKVYEKALKVLSEKKIPHELQIISAHRDPDKLDNYIKECEALIYIAVAGLSAALPGVIASKTDKPVIGVPVDSKLACVGIDRGENAAYLAIRILNLLKE